MRAHRWLCHPDSACEDGCDAQPLTAQLRKLARWEALQRSRTSAEQTEFERLTSHIPREVRE